MRNLVTTDRDGLGLGYRPPGENRREHTFGFYQSPVFRKNDYPRLQILTIGGLLNGSEKPRYPDVSGGTATFKKAQTHINDPKQKSLF